MNETLLASEWEATRRRSIQMLAVALVLFATLSAVVFVENLHHSEFGFLAGVLVGVHGYWAVLETMTVLRINRLINRAAAPEGEGVQQGSNPTG